MQSFLQGAMPDTKPKPKCAHCGHAWAKHTTQPVHPCAMRIPVGWTGYGRDKRPIMGTCACPVYEPREAE